MINEKTIQTLLLQLCHVYPDLKRSVDGKHNFAVATQVWLRTLSGMSHDELVAATDMTLRTHRECNVTPVHILDALDKAKNAVTDEPDIGDIFEDIVKGINNWEYHESQVDFGGWKAKFPITEVLARKLGGWGAISRDEVNRDVLRSNAIRIYDQMEKRELDVARLPESAKRLNLGQQNVSKLTDGIGRIGEVGE